MKRVVLLKRSVAVYFGAAIVLYACLMVMSATANDHYVWKDGGGHSPPYTNWTTAATNIQAAIDEVTCLAGDTVWVRAGTYDTGGVTNYPSGAILTNRVAISKAITLRSENDDRANTIIKGAWDPGDPTRGIGDAAIRCVYMASGSTLIGFTLTNGSTRSTSPVAYGGRGGGGAYASGATISNCVFAGNGSNLGGGGVYQGTIYDSLFTGNICEYHGGGTRQSTMHRCTMRGNTAPYGAGASGSSLYSCLVIGNAGNGFNFDGGTIRNCTIVGNSGKGVYFFGGPPPGYVYNSIVYSNAVNHDGVNVIFTNSCTTPAVSGWDDGNTTNNPKFVTWGSGVGLSHLPGNYHLQRTSPCVDAGLYQSWMDGAQDLDGRSRIVGAVDMGAYELPPPQATVVQVQ